MKGLVIMLTYLPGILLGVSNPVLALLTWHWIGVGSPHRLVVYSFVAFQPWAMMVALSSVLGVMRFRSQLRVPWTTDIKLFVAFTLWMVVTTVFAFYPDDSVPGLVQSFKINGMLLLTAGMLKTKKHMILFGFIFSNSVGLYGLKGGIFTILTGGGERVWGPDNTFIGGNNEIGLALVMTIPIMRWCQMQAQHKWVQRFYTMVMILCAFAALGTQSRGALLALSSMGVVMWVHSKKKVAGAIFGVVIAITLVSFMPKSWSDRMNSIKGAEKKDDSAKGRINAWKMCTAMASQRITGAGFEAYNKFTYETYAPEIMIVAGKKKYFVAHSIYFSVLGEHGFPGLGLFLILMYRIWALGGWLRKNSPKIPEARWCAELGTMGQVSLVGYMVGGTFLSLAYFDLPWDLLVLLVLVQRWVKEKTWLTEQPSNGKLDRWFGFNVVRSTT